MKSLKHYAALSGKRARLPLLMIASVAVLSNFTLQQYDAIGESPARQAASPIRQQLRNQVEKANGSPLKGRDPANQSQSSLLSAAAQSNGIGRRTDKPAVGVRGDTRRVDPASVLPDSKKTGVMANGCLIDYGQPGQECVPARMISKTSIACDEIRKVFPNGVLVSGTDRFGLDTDSDGIACGPGDGKAHH